jgi:hypothetical protein
MHRLAIALLAAGVFAVGIHWGTFAVGGSDSYCYVHQAERWATGTLQVAEPLALEAPWPDAPRTFAPAGHIPSPTVRGAYVPICPAGLSIFMAPAVRVGAVVGWVDAVYVVVPLFGALLVCATYVLGSRFSRRVGLASALLVACSPAFLFQLMQPMSDVPAAALWMLAGACATGRSRRAPLWAGLATSAAILVRPNLLPLGLVLGCWFVLHALAFDSDSGDDATHDSDSGEGPTQYSDSGEGATKAVESRRVGGLAPVAIFAAASAVGCVVVALIQQTFYGSPFSSGYGGLSGLFATEHILPNAVRYATWLWQSHTPVWLVALAAPFLIPTRLTALLFLLIIVNVVCYLPYVVFNDWWYLRFLLPAIAMLLVLMAAVVDAIVRTSRLRAAVITVATMVICLLFIREASARRVFDLYRLERRYARAGNYLATHAPQNAFVITSWESGSVRYYGHRNTLAWDALDPGWLDRAVAYLRTRGYEPYLLFEGWEEPNFRQRFVGSSIAKLDWPPSAEIAGQVRIYRPDDRERYLRGVAAPTEYAR